MNITRQSKLTKHSDHINLPAWMDGFGTTITKTVEITGGDVVPVLSINSTIFLGVTFLCAIGSGPLAMFTVPVSLLAGLIITANDVAVCSQYKKHLDSIEVGDDYNSQEYWGAMDEYAADSCADCHHFQSNRDRVNPGNGQCTRYHDAAIESEWCESFEAFQASTRAIVASHKTILPAAPIIEPAPIAVVTPPITVSRKSIVDSDEELSIAATFGHVKRDEPLSPMCDRIHRSLSEHLKANPSGWTNTLDEVVNRTDLPPDEVKGYFKELSSKKPALYQMQDLPTMRLIVRGAA